jgi:hypothetical protein
MFCGGRAESLIVFNQSGLEILGDARVMNRLVVFTNENINIEGTLHFPGLPSRSLLEGREEVQNSPPTLCSGVAVFALAALRAKAGGEGS